TFADKLRQEIFPAFDAETTQGMSQDISSFDSAAFLDRFDYWIRRTLIDFARDSLKPTVLAAVAMTHLERSLRFLNAERRQAALGELTLGVRPDPEADLPDALRDLAVGRVERSAFLERFGHRGNEEMELSRPRWGEKPESLSLFTGQTHGSQSVGLETSRFDQIAVEAKLSASQQNIFKKELQSLHTYLGLRET